MQEAAASPLGGPLTCACEQVGVSWRGGEGRTQAPRTFFSYTSCHAMLAKKRCCMISLASSEPPPSLWETEAAVTGSPAAGPKVQTPPPTG